MEKADLSLAPPPAAPDAAEPKAAAHAADTAEAKPVPQENPADPVAEKAAAEPDALSSQVAEEELPEGRAEAQHSAPPGEDQAAGQQIQITEAEASSSSLTPAGNTVELTANSGPLKITTARAVTGEGAPIDPTQSFPEDADSLYVAFSSEAKRSERVRLTFFADDVAHLEPGTEYADGSLTIPAGERNYFYLRPPRGGFEPGRYRVAVETDGKSVEIPFTIEPKYPFALREDEVELPRGYDLALAALGGRVERATSQYDERRWAAANLIDGLAFDVDDSGSNCATCGWSSRDDELPQEIVLSFREQREAAIAAVVIDPTTWETQQYPDRMAKHVEVWASPEVAGDDFTRIAAARLHQDFVAQVIALPEGTRARRLKLMLTANFGGTYTQLGEVGVIEAGSLEASILDGAAIDLARRALGGAVVRLTSWGDSHSVPAALVDGDPAGEAWRSDGEYLPQEFVFAFRDDLPALIDRIVLHLGPDEAAETWPRRVNVAISAHPLDGFEEVALFELPARPGEHAFTIGREARFVRLRVLENGGGPRTTLNAVALIEGTRPGYVPLLLREDAPRPGSPEAVTSAGADIVADAKEAEPNDVQPSANPLPFASFTRGSIDPLGEIDWFALGPETADARAITFELAGWPNVRTSLSLLDAGGQMLRDFDPGKRPTEQARFTWLLDGTERFVQVTEPEVSVVLVWDTSGSMQGRTEDLERAVRAYVDQVPPSQRLSLIRFSADVEILLDDFTTDKDRLRSAIQGKFTAEGGTRFYDAVAKAIELLQGVPGNRAIVVMSDGADTGSEIGHPGFWQLLEDERVRLYAIGLGSGMHDPLPSFGSTGERILGHAALATNGRLLFAEASEQLAAFYAEIAEELHRPASYFVKPTLDRGEARFDVVATGERITRVTAPQIELILDASGSMRERKKRIDERLKIEVAKDVLREVIATMPEHGEVALRVYGRRIREGSPGDCQDTELLYPFAPLDRARLLAQVDQRQGTSALSRARRSSC